MVFGAPLLPGSSLDVADFAAVLDQIVNAERGGELLRESVQAWGEETSELWHFLRVVFFHRNELPASSSAGTHLVESCG